jgi:hypothetical protein
MNQVGEISFPIPGEFWNPIDSEHKRSSRRFVGEGLPRGLERISPAEPAVTGAAGIRGDHSAHRDAHRCPEVSAQTIKQGRRRKFAAFGAIARKPSTGAGFRGFTEGI